MTYSGSKSISLPKYIGQTIQPQRRHYQHFWKPELDNHNYFHNAIAKYGKDVWQYEILYEVTENERESVKDILNEKERFFIETLDTMYPNGYNMTNGGDANKIVIEEVRQIISEKQKGNQYRKGAVLSVEEKTKISVKVKAVWCDDNMRKRFVEATRNAMKNEKVRKNVANAQKKRFEDPSQRELISARTREAMRSLEVREKLSKAKRGKPALNKLHVRQYDKDGKFIQEYESLTEASNITGTHIGEISKVCNRKKWTKTAGGFIWRFSNDCEDLN